jgi:hypothetical protein
MPLRVPIATLRRLYDLPAFADETTVRAAMRCSPPLSKAQAAAKISAGARTATRRAAPTPRLDTATVSAATNAELTAMAAGSLAATERDVVEAELFHRTIMGRCFPGVAPGARFESPRARIQFFG